MEFVGISQLAYPSAGCLDRMRRAFDGEDYLVARLLLQDTDLGTKGSPNLLREGTQGQIICITQVYDEDAPGPENTKAIIVELLRAQLRWLAFMIETIHKK